MKVTRLKTVLFLLLITAVTAGIIWSCGKEDPVEPVVAVTSVSLNKTSLSLMEGESETLTASVLPDNAANKSVGWESSDTGIATVSGGKVTAVKAGATTITAKTSDGGKTAVCTVTVTANKVEVTGVKLNKSTLSLTVGDSETLTATVEPADATNKSVTWASSASTIATVENGKVTAVSAGTAKITVTTDGNKTAVCTVTVTAATVAVTGVTLPATLNLKVDEKVTLTATVTPSNATNKNVTWKSSNTAVATVSTAGVVTGVKAGTTTITVTTVDGGKTATCSVTVSAAVTPPVITKQPVSVTVDQGGTATFSVTASNAKSYQWENLSKSSNTWNEIIEGQIASSTYEGSKTATFKVINAHKILSNYQYRCVVTNDEGSVTSNPVTLTVIPYTCGVVMLNRGDQAIEVIRVIREYTELGVKDAKELVESTPPVTLATGLDCDIAHEFVSALIKAGASAKVEQDKK